MVEGTELKCFPCVSSYSGQYSAVTFKGQYRSTGPLLKRLVATVRRTDPLRCN